MGKSKIFWIAIGDTVNLHEQVSKLIVDMTGFGGEGAFSLSPASSLGVFLPEIALCLTIILMLLARVLFSHRRVDVFYIALIGSGIALYLASLNAPVLDQRMEIFTGLLVYDSFTVFIRSLLLLFTVLFLLLTRLTGIPDRIDGPDIYTLVLGATVGMCLMASANHLMIVFMAVEMVSVPSYALAGLMKGRPRASEAALKYSIYGAGTAGVMLYGISLIAGLVNTAHLPSIANELAIRLPTMSGDEWMVLALGGLMIMVGLAFKLSAVPFHFWCPDVFEGATAEVDALLSVASKAAALALLVRVAIGLGVQVPEGLPAGMPPLEIVAGEQWPEDGLLEDGLLEDGASGTFAVEDGPPSVLPASHRDDDTSGDTSDVTETKAAGLGTLRNMMARMIALLAVLTCTFGNLAAYGQTNIKRLLAYSTIAHAGYMMMAIPPLMAMAELLPAGAERAAAALGLYLTVYVFMNLGAFTVVAFLRNTMRSETIADYGGLIRHCPGIVICFSLILFGLVGLPPLSGFLGKFAIFASLAEGYRVTSEPYLLILLVVGGINTVISLFYYLRIVRVMIMEPDAENRGPVSFPLVSWPGIYLVAVTLPTALLFLRWNFLNEIVVAASRQLLG